MRAGGNRIRGTAQVGDQHRHLEPGNAGGKAHDFRGVGQLWQYFRRDEGTHFNLAQTRVSQRLYPALFIRGGHNCGDTLQAIPRPHFTDFYIDRVH